MCPSQNEVTIQTVKLSNSVYMLKGQGGNIGVSIGTDGVFVIDDQFAPLTPKILSAIRALSDLPIKYVANTHFHGDHTGGNANFQKEGATIIAHDNVRARLLLPKRDGSATPKEALPVLTFNDAMSIYMNGEKVAVFHVDKAHTDGDAVLYFTKSNVLHTGDTFFKDRYPYIDLKSGGSVDGYIAAVKRSLMLIDDQTKIIPGHGGLASKKDYESFLKMLETLKTQVLQEIAKGKSETEVVNNTAITKAFDDLGYSWRFINSEKIRRTFYQSLKNQNTN
jgi:glyoxylase-like metal-dependent hydrolase (beta-lactamase superfamily II)